MEIRKQLHDHMQCCGPYSSIAAGKCIGATCMAFRLSVDSDGDENGFAYCGLAGQPGEQQVRLLKFMVGAVRP